MDSSNIFYKKYESNGTKVLLQHKELKYRFNHCLLREQPTDFES